MLWSECLSLNGYSTLKQRLCLGECDFDMRKLKYQRIFSFFHLLKLVIIVSYILHVSLPDMPMCALHLGEIRHKRLRKFAEL